MQKDRDEQHYDHEESEYHFSDDDVSYEVETEASKPAAPEPEKNNPVAGLTQSKRMIISLVVFLGLVFVVYKMVSPGTSVPSTEIAPVTAQVAAPAPAMAPPAIPHTAAPTQQAEAASPAQPTTQPTMPTQPVAAPTQAQTAAPATQAQTAAPATTTTTVVTTSTPATAQPVGATPQVAQAQPAPAQPSAIPPAPISSTPPQQAVPGQPPAMPPQAAAPSNAAPSAGPMPVATTVVTTSPVTPSNTDATIAAMAATNEKLMNQLQADYSQKVTDFTNQNKALQDQMQSLNSRVAGLESQLNQLVQTLTRQTGMGGTTSLNVVPAQQPPPPPTVQQRISYSVQAIIPGRAWLKSDNGETLTVAEGDTIKELGRVTKIDPYDGVVEVNTGNKTVSISYGSGG